MTVVIRMIGHREEIEKLSDNQRQYNALFGDLKQKEDVYIILKKWGPEVIERFFSAKSHASWLRRYAPEFVPPDNPNGTSPSDHTVSTYFEAAYLIPSFRAKYIDWLQTQDV
ncbi:hypothetical protein [Fusarium graminearum alphavirus-like virus 1]|uniref:RNAse III-like virus domain-containing protein n=1 Tax=Fusarium graminearum alphavirus-like virus 1 TaxID=2683609 RepID=A0A650G1X2_9VIRU|nr:hypothetical protein [Fusarium graminearum alphavirus-like virus 1]